MADEPTSGRMPPAQAQLAMHSALNGPLPRFYANSFINGATDADVLTVFQANGQNVFICNFSWVIAKTLANALTQLVADFEKRNGVVVKAIETGSAMVGLSQAGGPPPPPSEPTS